MVVINEENQCLLNDIRNFSEIFRKDVTYDNISSKKSRALPPLQKIHLLKNHRHSQIDLSSLFRVKDIAQFTDLEMLRGQDSILRIANFPNFPNGFITSDFYSANFCYRKVIFHKNLNFVNFEHRTCQISSNNINTMAHQYRPHNKHKH